MSEGGSSCSCKKGELWVWSDGLVVSVFCHESVELTVQEFCPVPSSREGALRGGALGEAALSSVG